MTKEYVPEMLSLRETSERSGLSYDAIRKMCLSDQIVYIRCGRKFLVNWDRFCDFLNGGVSNES